MIALALLSIAGSPAALAHAGERVHLLLLPTGYYLVGGALTVAVTFALLALVPVAALQRIAGARLVLGSVPACGPHWPGWVMLTLVAALVVCGFAGSRDPLSNPLPLAVWSLFWVGFALLHALFGNLWAWLSPWPALRRVLVAVPPLSRWREQAPLAYPDAAGYWPAVLMLLAVVWMELVYPAPLDPERLAIAACIYLALTAAGVLLFGDAWLQRADVFTVFFRLLSWLSPLDVGAIDARGRRALSLVWPGARLLTLPALPASAVAFVLCSLATVSFDGLSDTFFWMALLGENPLEYPGRSALVGANTLGLIVTVLVFLAAYVLVIAAGRRLAGARAASVSGARLVLSIVPIAFGYHFAHYMTVLAVDAQLALLAFNDPLGRGWDLLGLSHFHPKVAFLSHAGSVLLIWNLQVAAIVGAHVVAVAIAHLLSLDDADPEMVPAPQPLARTAATFLLPMTALMVAYTLLGLWLLSTPTAA